MCISRAKRVRAEVQRAKLGQSILRSQQCACGDNQTCIEKVVVVRIWPILGRSQKSYSSNFVHFFNHRLRSTLCSHVSKSNRIRGNRTSWTWWCHQFSSMMEPYDTTTPPFYHASIACFAFSQVIHINEIWCKNEVSGSPVDENDETMDLLVILFLLMKFYEMNTLKNAYQLLNSVEIDDLTSISGCFVSSTCS